MNQCFNDSENKAKKDYLSGNYSWFDLRNKYPELSIRQVFKVIFEARQKKEKEWQN